MDLLGSIMNKMEKPPVIKKNAKEEEMIKKQKKNFEKMQEIEKQKLKEFRKKVITEISEFINNKNKEKIEFEPMENIYRTIIHDVSENQNLQGISFGIDGLDRHVVVYKKEFLPCEEEILCLKRGEIYDPGKIKQQKEFDKELKRDIKKQKIIPISNYADKYKHIIGEESGKEAAQKTKPNEQFGCVPSSNKKDQRSIEQTLDDIKKKKQKVFNTNI